MKKIILLVGIIMMILISGCNIFEDLKDVCDGNMVDSLNEGLFNCLKETDNFEDCYICCSKLREDGLLGCNQFKERYCLEICK